MKDLTQGSEAKRILHFALPMLFGNVFQQLYNIIDSIIVGNYLGKEALGAVGASFPLIFVLISMVIGLSSGATIIIAQYFGAKNYAKVKLAIDTMNVILFISSIVVSAIGIIFSDEIFKLIKLPAEIIPQATTYFNIFILGSVTMFGFHGTAAILRGLGDSKTPLYFLILSTILNIFLDLLFIVVFGWGIEGVAIATVISQGVSFLMIVLYLNKYHKIIQISFLKINFEWEMFMRSLRIGLPSGFQQTIVSLGLLALFRIVNDFGTDTVAAYSVAGRIDSFAILPAMNFAAAFSTFVGQNLGANKAERVRKGLVATLIMTSIISVSLTLIINIFRTELMRLFSPDTNVIEIGAEYLQIVSLFYILFSVLFVFNAVFRGAGDTLMPMFITLSALWVVRVPLSVFLSQKIGVVGIWWGIPAGWGVGMTFSLVYYFIGKWKTKVIVKY
jgi:putative MATE family efflux protein